MENDKPLKLKDVEEYLTEIFKSNKPYKTSTGPTVLDIRLWDEDNITYIAVRINTGGPPMLYTGVTGIGGLQQYLDSGGGYDKLFFNKRELNKDEIVSLFKALNITSNEDRNKSI